MQIGFTGTQHGMTEYQRGAVAGLLDVLCCRGGHVHHGDCIGADEEFHVLARERGLRVELHPPNDSSKRAFCDADIKWPEYPYLKRNRHIVDNSDVVIATPQTETEVRRSGTWATVRYARLRHKRVLVVYPEGVIRQTGGEK